jgi:DNA-binding MarR family transcriptional regulator
VGSPPPRRRSSGTCGSGGRQGARVSEVAEALAVTPATASESTDALVRKGLVRKARVAEDGRARLVVLTPAGRKEAERLAGWPDFLLRAVRRLPASEQATLLRVLLKTIRELQRAGRIPVSRMCVTCGTSGRTRTPTPNSPTTAPLWTPPSATACCAWTARTTWPRTPSRSGRTGSAFPAGPESAVRTPGCADPGGSGRTAAWRRGWDSNPQGLAPTGFRDRAP